MDFDFSDATGGDNSLDMDTNDASDNDTVDFGDSEITEAESLEPSEDIEILDLSDEDVSDSPEDMADVEAIDSFDADEIEILDYESENDLGESAFDEGSSDVDSMNSEFEESQAELDTSPDLDGDDELSDSDGIEEVNTELDAASLDSMEDEETSDDEEIEALEAEDTEEAGDLPTEEVTAAEEEIFELDDDVQKPEIQLEGDSTNLEVPIEDVADAAPDIDPESLEFFSEFTSSESEEINNPGGEETNDPVINTELPGSYPNPYEYEEESGTEETDIDDVGEAEEVQEVPKVPIIDDTVSDIPELEFETTEEDALQDGVVSDENNPSEAEIPVEGIETISDFPEFLENDSEQARDIEGEAFKPDQAALWEAGLHAIDNDVEALRDNLRDQGMEDGPEMEAIVIEFRKDSMEELRQDLEGGLSEGDFMEIHPGEEESFDQPLEQIDADSIMAESETPDDLPEISVETDDLEEIPEASGGIDEPEEISEIEDGAFDVSSSEDIQDVDQVTERQYDDFERSVMDEKPDFYDSGAFYEQGINEYGYEGTCGPTSQANAINKLLETNEFTEQKILKVAVDNDLCNMDKSPENCGGTTTEQFMELYDTVNEQIGDKIQTELYEYENALSVEEAAAKLDEGCVLNVAVDAMALWDQPREYVNALGIPCDDFYSDHWITVTGVRRDEAGRVLGFNIIDSGGGVDYVDADKYQEMCFGSDEHRVLDPTAVVVSKKDNPIDKA